jgi:drug/metabolite transporter (DMT)-like permease
VDAHRSGCLLAALSAILFATKGVLIKDAIAAGAPATAILGVRMAVSLPCFILVAWWMGRKAAPIPRADLLRMAALGVIGYHLASWLDIHGLAHISVALERVVLYVYPTLIVGLGWALGRGRPGGGLLLAVVITWLGIAVSYASQPLGGTDLTWGVALVLGSAAAFAIYVVSIEPLTKRHGGVRTVAVAMCAACTSAVVHAAMAVAPSAWMAQSPVLWSRGIALALVGTMAPVLLAGAALRLIGGGPSAVIGTIGPGITVLLGWYWLGEAPTIWTWIGLAMTLAGGLMISLTPRR